MRSQQISRWLSRRQHQALSNIVLILAGAVCIRPACAQNLPSGFALQSVVLDPFDSLPIGFSFLPDGRILVIEKDTGNVRLSAVGSGVSSVIATVPNLATQSERGLLGVAVDPAWPARPYIYFHSTHADSTLHLTMYTAAGDLTNPTSTSMTLTTPYVLLSYLDQYEHHNGGTLRFGPDGHLYASIGDDGWTCRVQDVNYLNGKILRLDISGMPGAGVGPPPVADITPADNPFSGTSEVARLVFARGLRNPFRFTIDPQTGNLYIGDVGDLTWEEVDELVYSNYVGDNYGWPELEGFVPNPCCSTCTHDPPYAAPIYVYQNPPDPMSAAVTGGPIYRRVLGSPFSFGAEYDGNCFLADWAGRWLRRLVRTESGWALAAPVPGQPNAQDWAANIGRFVDLQSGPDGALYFASYFGIARGVWRIVRTGSVDADFEAGGASWARAFPNPGRAGLTIEFQLPRPVPVTVRIFDVTGRLVRVLPGPATGAGSMSWNGRAANGRLEPPGIYFYRIDSPVGPGISGRIVLVE